MVERFNRTLKDMVAKYTRLDGSAWDEVIGATVIAYNISKHSTTGYTPFFLAHGREARLPVDSLTERPQKILTVNSYVEIIYDTSTWYSTRREKAKVQRGKRWFEETPEQSVN